jgi:sRNA-binding protein
MHEGIARLAELYPNCFRQPRQPLKIGTIASNCT